MVWRINDAMDFLRNVSGRNISVNWKALAETGVTPDVTITLKLRSVSLRKALDLILSEAGGGDKLGFSVDEGVIEIATREIIDSKMYTRVYPIEDLIMIIPDFDDAPDFSLTSQTSGTQGGSSGAGGARRRQRFEHFVRRQHLLEFQQGSGQEQDGAGERFDGPDPQHCST